MSGKYIFWFYEALNSKGILNTVKRGITSAMECADLAAFTFRYMTNAISHFVTLFLQKPLSKIHLQFCDYFWCPWATEANSLAVFSRRVKRFKEKLNICCGKQELARACSVCVSARGKPNC